jgi:hypothetical protein
MQDDLHLRLKVRSLHHRRQISINLTQKLNFLPYWR